MLIRIRVAVVLLKDNRFLLVNHQKEGESYWLLPGGGVEAGESLDIAAKREVKEEVGLDIEIKKLLFVNDSIGFRHILNLTFLGKITGGHINVAKDNRLKDAKFFDLMEVEDLTLYPNLKKPLKQAYLSNFKDDAVYLGNLWA